MATQDLSLHSLETGFVFSLRCRDTYISILQGYQSDEHYFQQGFFFCFQMLYIDTRKCSSCPVSLWWLRSKKSPCFSYHCRLQPWKQSMLMCACWMQHTLHPTQISCSQQFTLGTEEGFPLGKTLNQMIFENFCQLIL